MRRRSSNSGTPLTAKQQELSARENELREKMQQLEQMIQEAPRKAQEKMRQQQEELLLRAGDESRRLNVELGVRDMRHSDFDFRPGGGRRVALRKERREGRLIFLVLVMVLAAVVFWLMRHLPF
jgi:TolA-binding protein